MTGQHHRLRAAAGPLPTFISSSTARASATTVTVTAPANIQDGDLLIAVGFGSASYCSAVPSNFSLINNIPFASGTTDAFFLATKTASSESGNYTFTFAATAVIVAQVMVFRNATTVNTVGTMATDTSDATQNMTATSITPTYKGATVAAFYHPSNGTVNTAPTGMNLVGTNSGSSPDATIACYYKNSQTASATGNYTITWGSTSTMLMAILFQVTNEPLTLTPSFVASANNQTTSSSTSLTIDKPTGTAQNDLMIAIMASGTNSTWTGDTDWTEIGDQGARPCLRIAYKVAGASEGANYTFTQSSSGTASGCILTYRNATYDTVAASFTTAANPLVVSSVTAASAQSILIIGASRQAASITLGTPPGMTARVTDADGTSPSLIALTQAVPKGPVNRRYISTGSTSNVAALPLIIKPSGSF